MRVKKYRAKTIKEATDKVKGVLGPDAMIISTQKLPQSGGGSLFEVTAMTGREMTGEGSSDQFGEVKQELMSIREMLCLLNRSGGFMEKLIMSPGVINLYARLIKNGVDDHNAKTLLERAGALNGHSADNKNTIKEEVLNEIKQVIKTKDLFMEEDKKQTIAAFVGTTGVGKTTTIAKLAAQLMLKAKKTVGLISIDAYRIGAMEQLKTYANILGIPCFQAFKKNDLLFALRRMEGRDVVLIDTAGQSQYDLSRIEELRKMMPGDIAIDTHLLLSIGTLGSEMKKSADNFSCLKYKSYLFTKADEARTCGSIINQVMKLNFPLSYITTGQNVPEDIENADKEKIVNMVVQ